MWKADTLRPGQFVALKVFPEPGVNLALIRHELAQALRLNDPEDGWPDGVVPVVDFQLDGDRPWIMYEYVGGGTLAELIARGAALPNGERIHRATTAWPALARACAQLHTLTPPLVHRDLKPTNVLYDPATKRLKITDLGIGVAANAHELESEKTVARNAAGVLSSQMLGSHSALYASPEQRKGNPPDPRDDVHALGVIAYQMITGKLDASPGSDAW